MTTPSLPSSRPWRESLPVHPAADMFPLLSKTDPAALEELRKDIRENGLQSEVVIWVDEDGKESLLDGRNRLDAAGDMANLFIKGAIRIDRTIAADPYDYVISANIHRRHLTFTDKRNLIRDVLKAQSEKSDRAIADQLKVDKNVVGRERKRAEATGALAPVEKRTGKDGKRRRQPAQSPAKTNGAAPAEEPAQNFTALSNKIAADAAAIAERNAQAARERETQLEAPDNVVALTFQRAEQAESDANTAELKTREAQAQAAQKLPGEIGPVLEDGDTTPAAKLFASNDVDAPISLHAAIKALVHWSKHGAAFENALPADAIFTTADLDAAIKKLRHLNDSKTMQDRRVSARRELLAAKAAAKKAAKTTKGGRS